MVGKTIEMDDLIDGVDGFAEAIATQYSEWNAYRSGWLEEKKELRNYLFATSTKTTSNQRLPWKNSTTMPKLTQIRDNLHANYMAALFPNDNWLSWEGDDAESNSGEKRNVITDYMRNKTRNSEFRQVVAQLVYDYIDYGNCFATVDFFDETRKDDQGNVIPGYVGPRPVRVSPYDIVFNPMASDFASSPKIVRTIKSLGELKVELEENPEKGYLEDVFNLIVTNRQKVSAVSEQDVARNDAYINDGFSSAYHYYSSGYIELLDFVGDIYDVEAEKLYKDHIITVVDRKHIIRMTPNPTWRKSLIRHAGWRLRPDNIYAMGPLDNLVGLQYRIDHLENLRADVFDLIAHPIEKVKGVVEDYEYKPGARIYLGDDGDVQHMRPDTTALQADNQIAIIEQRMEDMAGAPKQAMGIRTPGEKTAFEVQTLDNASGRIFQNKIEHFEIQFLEPLLNDMLETARRNMASLDVVASIDSELGVAVFQDITPEDLTAKGRIYPVGARHFAAKANQMQNLVQLSNSGLGQDPAVAVHISGLKIAELMQDLLNLQKFDLVSPNIRVLENQKTQQLINTAQGVVDEQAAIANEQGIPNGAEARGPVDEAPTG